MISLPTEVAAEPPLTAAEAQATEASLVRAAAGGDTRAFEELMRANSRRVFNFLYHMTRQSQDAEDLAQQTFLKAYQNIHRFDASRPLINWLLVIARRTALNHFRAHKKWESVPEETPSAGLSPARSAEERDGAESLWARARAVLSRREFEVLWLRFAEELSTEETARVAGLTQTHVKVLVYRARQTLLKGVNRL
jgi:RNA polymerase sigma-70 factor (ECF subfamily)